MGCNYLIFYAGLRLLFPDIESSRGSKLLFLLSAEHSVVMSGALRCTARDGATAWLMVCSPCLVVQGHYVSSPRMAAYVQDGYWKFRQPNLSVVVAKCWFLSLVVAARNCMCFCIYFNPDIHDRIFDCLLIINGWRSCRLRMWVPLSCLWVIWMPIIRSGWVLWPRIVMEWQPLTVRLCLIAFSWLLARPMHVVKLMTSLWLIFLT